MKIDRALVNGTIITPEGRFRGDIGIKDGRIAAVTESGAVFAGGELIDCTGKFILPSCPQQPAKDLAPLRLASKGILHLS
jgi:predicted amidohydrolase YtcJ